MVVMTRMYSVVGMICGHLIFQKACSGGTVHLGSLDQRLVDVAQGGNVQNNGLADGGGEQDQDDAAQGVSGVASQLMFWSRMPMDLPR